MLTVLAVAASAAGGNIDSDSAALLSFKSFVKDPTDALSSWTAGSHPCNTAATTTSRWTGVICFSGSIWGIQLQHMALGGQIDVDSLERLKSLRTLSLMNNSFEGSIPAVNKLGTLKALFLSNNKLSGEIPDGTFDGMLSLKKLHLAHNQFSGQIPESLVELPRLMELTMEDNRFTGAIPEFKQKKLQVLKLSKNALEGPIPPSLSKLDPSSFEGNKALCNPPLAPCSSASPPSPPPPGKKNSSSNRTAIVVVLAVLLGLALLLAGALLIFCLTRRRSPRQDSLEIRTPSNLQKKASLKDEIYSMHGSPEHSQSENDRKQGDVATRLSFLKDGGERFELQDLLKASAEILGSGCFGSSYKAALPSSGTVMVVKRFRQMNNLEKEEFQEHMRRLGRLDHPNLLPVVAYYYRKEEKLLISNFVAHGSLAVHLHSECIYTYIYIYSSAGGQPALDCPTRLKIIKGIARGLMYLYQGLPTLTAPHGHLKSSNVLLNDSLEPLLNDYGLVPVINQESAEELMVAYKSPEHIQNARITRKTDIWCLGVLILEILTGKFPASFLQKGNSADQDRDMATWLKTIEDSSTDPIVFDKEMKVPADAEGEMVKLLKIGLACCEADVEKRMELNDAVEKIEEVKVDSIAEVDDADGFYSTRASEADLRSSKEASNERPSV
ncbi:hypothetical protein SAY86_009717 [Trapa natans]|uniref:Protein kinase domain-containing protein n=1 Tax=Trapa natans TaxID=22666 RepID=A0AAN7QQF8_TRANT|nr:hypothetical protein SAY86_009717 [Trapa natans]